ncbi:hypothetical protein D3C81_971060 [compost metagenome]
MLLQQTVEVGQLRHHADGAEDGEGRGEDLLADAGHHVAAAGRHLVHAHGQRHAGLADARQLRGGQAVAVHHAAAALQTHHHLVLRGGQAEQRSDLVAQVLAGRSLDVAVEVQHVDPRLVAAGLLLGLFRLGFFLAQRLQLLLVQHAVLQALAQVLVEVVELVHVELPAGTTLAGAQRGNAGQDDEDGSQDGHCPGQKTGVIGKKLHGDSLFAWSLHHEPRPVKHTGANGWRPPANAAALLAMTDSNVRMRRR